MAVRLGAGDQFGKDDLGELLAELDSPLIETVDVPDDALGENLVLIQGDEPAKGEGRQAVIEDRHGRSVALEDLMRSERIND